MCVCQRKTEADRQTRKETLEKEKLRQIVLLMWSVTAVQQLSLSVSLTLSVSVSVFLCLCLCLCLSVCLSVSSSVSLSLALSLSFLFGLSANMLPWKVRIHLASTWSYHLWNQRRQTPPDQEWGVLPGTTTSLLTSCRSVYLYETIAQQHANCSAAEGV